MSNRRFVSPFLLAAGLVLIPRLAALQEKAAPAEAAIEFVMPAHGAFIPGGPVIVAGRLPPGAEWVNLLLDGEPAAEVNRDGRSFDATLTPVAGIHELEARAGSISAKITFTYGTGGRGAPPYRYHRPVLERRCAECHAGVRRQVANAEAATCKNCHRALAVIYPYVHGPVAAGKCLVCHDPHGSSWPALMPTAAKTMCTSCHDQPSSLQHIEKSRSQVCYLCHNPHAGMYKKFLYDIVK